jgi:hypothetical protein
LELVVKPQRLQSQTLRNTWSKSNANITQYYVINNRQTTPFAHLPRRRQHHQRSW